MASGGARGCRSWLTTGLGMAEADDLGAVGLGADDFDKLFEVDAQFKPSKAESKAKGRKERDTANKVRIDRAAERLVTRARGPERFLRAREQRARRLPGLRLSGLPGQDAEVSGEARAIEARAVALARREMASQGRARPVASTGDFIDDPKILHDMSLKQVVTEAKEGAARTANLGRQDGNVAQALLELENVAKVQAKNTSTSINAFARVWRMLQPYNVKTVSLDELGGLRKGSTDALREIAKKQLTLLQESVAEMPIAQQRRIKKLRAEILLEDNKQVVEIVGGEEVVRSTGAILSRSAKGEKLQQQAVADAERAIGRRPLREEDPKVAAAAAVELPVASAADEAVEVADDAAAPAAATVEAPAAVLPVETPHVVKEPEVNAAEDIEFADEAGVSTIPLAPPTLPELLAFDNIHDAYAAMRDDTILRQAVARGFVVAEEMTPESLVILRGELAFSDWQNLRDRRYVAQTAGRTRVSALPTTAAEAKKVIRTAAAAFQRGDMTDAAQRGGRIAELVLDGNDLSAMAPEAVAAVLFSNLGPEAQAAKIEDGTVGAFVDQFAGRVETRLRELTEAAVESRKLATAAEQAAQATTDKQAKKSYQAAATRHAGQADAAEDFVAQATSATPPAAAAATPPAAAAAVPPAAAPPAAAAATPPAGAPPAAAPPGAPPRGAAPVPPVSPIPGNIKGMVYFFDDASAILYAFKSADASTGLHEMAHVLRRNLRPNHLQVTLDWVNSLLPTLKGPSGKPLRAVHLNDSGNFKGDAASVVEAEELFARAFEQYLAEGVAPTATLQKVFEVIKDLMHQIYGALVRGTFKVDISDEMYTLFDDIFGATNELSLGDLDQVGRYLDNEALLSESLTRVGGRLITDAPVEESLVENIRQSEASIADYAARTFKGGGGRLGAAAASGSKGEELPPRGSGSQGAAYGPMSRRLLSFPQMGQLAKKEASPALRGGATALTGLDWAAITTARFAKGLSQVFLIGGDPQAWLRASPTAARAFVNGPMRELEEYLSGFTTLVEDVGRRTGDARKSGLHDIFNFIRGRPVVLQTGAGRGEKVTATFVDGEYHFFRMLTEMLGRLDPKAREILLGQASTKLERSAGVSRVADTPALTGFWKGYTSASEKGATATEVDVADGLILSDDYRSLAVAQGSTRLPVGTVLQDTLGNLAYALMGAPISDKTVFHDGMQEVAALLLFYTGATPLNIGGVRVTREMLRQAKGSDSYLQLLYEGVSFEVGGKVTKLRGLNEINSIETNRTLGALLIMGQSGYVAGLHSDMARVGLGIHASAARAFFRYRAGLAATMEPSEVDIARDVAKRFGYDADFVMSPEAFGDFYIPSEARQALADRMSQGMRQLGLSGTDNVLSGIVGAANKVIMGDIVFGSIASRQTYKLASTMDLALGIGATAGGAAGAAAAARVSALTVLSMAVPQGVIGLPLLSPERLAEVADIVGTMVRRRTSASEQGILALKARLRNFSAGQGDELVNEVTRFFELSKYRVEVVPILENNPDVFFAFAGRVYSAQSLRRIFTRAGVYSNGFKGIKEVVRSEALTKGDSKMAFRAEQRMTELAAAGRTDISPANAEFLESATGEARTWFSRRASSAYSTVFEHGLESADAWSDLERTGGAVTLMEMGFTPDHAAQIVVKAVYDYRGSMTQGDRSLLRRILMPFWAFRKNATIQTLDLLASPRGRFVASALLKMPRMTAEAITTALYDSLLNPYDVNTTAMSGAQRDAYYEMRGFFELGIDEVTPEQLRAFREALPEGAGDISDEELMDYSFKGWTIRDGYNGFDNVPEDVRVMFRGMLSATTDLRSSGRFYTFSGALTSRQMRAKFTALGAKLAVRDGASLAGLPGYAIQRYVNVQVPIPVLDAALKESLRGGMGDSVYFGMSDNFAMSGLEHMGAIFALTTVAAEGAFGEPKFVSQATGVKLLNAVEPLTDFRDYNSPIGKLLVEAGKSTLGESDLYVELDPIMARLIEGTYGAPVGHTGTPDGSGDVASLSALPSETQRLLSSFASLPALGVADSIKFPYQESRTAFVSVEDGRRIVRFPDAQDGEYISPHNKGVRDKPYITGNFAAAFKHLSPLGRVNKALLAVRKSPQADAVAASTELHNAIFALIETVGAAAGVKVIGANYERAAAIDRPYVMLPR